MDLKRSRVDNIKHVGKVVIDIEDDTLTVENRLFSLERSVTKMENHILNIDAKLDALQKLSINMFEMLKTITSTSSSETNNTFQVDENDKTDSREESRRFSMNRRVFEIFPGSLLNISVEQNNVLSYIFKAKGNPEEIIVKMDGELGERKELQRLQPSKWLSAEILNLYASMLRWDNQYCNYEKTFESWYMPTYVSQSIISKMCDAGKIYRNYLRKDKFGGDFQKCEKIFIPINTGNHWYLCIVDIIKEEVQIMDSLRPVDYTDRSSTVKYVVKCFDEALEIGLGTNYTKNITNFPVEIAYWAPQQNNSSDCGVFTIKFMQLYKKLRYGNHFRIENSSSERMKMTLEIFYHESNQSKGDILTKIKNV